MCSNQSHANFDLAYWSKDVKKVINSAPKHRTGKGFTILRRRGKAARPCHIHMANVTAGHCKTINVVMVIKKVTPMMKHHPA